jgi:hypothetical protein
VSFRAGIGPERRGAIRVRKATPFEASRAALTYPTRLLLWVLMSPQPQGREAQITYYAHRVGERKAA